MREKYRKIEEIRKQFRKKREWLLIRVETADKSTTTPLTGRLLAHSPREDDILKKCMSYKGKDILIDYSEDTLPKGTAIIFPTLRNNV